jgi:hypothetical protein
MARARRPIPAGAEPLSPRRKWRAILLATLLLAPAYWSIVVGLVSAASDNEDAPVAGPFIAFGLALVPFVFMALAFLSEHPRAPSAVVKAMGLSLLVGIPASALAGDAVTGLVAGLGAGGVAALRADQHDSWKTRALGVAIASVWVFLTLRTTSEVAVVLAPALPFTSIGVADHLAERKRERAEAGRSPEAKRSTGANGPHVAKQ